MIHLTSKLQISTQGLELIKQFEGFRASPYICPGGYTTIGYGHVLFTENGQTSGPSKMIKVSVEEAEQLLEQDISVCLQALARLTSVPLTQGQMDALVSFIFNLGSGAFQRSTLRACINREDHEQATKEFLKWTRAGGRILEGLVRRRLAEAKLYQDNTISDSNPDSSELIQSFTPRNSPWKRFCDFLLKT